ncbi:MAG: class I SAM-dependent methyltransferase, partial [Gammaproteobacteria bacterium]
NIQVIPFSPPDQVKLGADGSADMVLTFRNTHDWLNKSDAALESAFKAAYAVLKPGGTFGVVEHRARPYSDAEISSRGLHRIPEDYMISLALQNGFVLAGVSEINANPKDDESVNVHRLMPDLVSKDQSLKAIGESDRMTLKFVKP